ncbi:MAG: hypothetical protein ACQETE_14600 [Bacteroidota bacterium]
MRKKSTLVFAVLCTIGFAIQIVDGYEHLWLSIAFGVGSVLGYAQFYWVNRKTDDEKT